MTEVLSSQQAGRTSPDTQPRLGLLAIGLEAYWDQFEGLRQQLLGYLGRIEQGPTFKMGNTNSRIRFPLPPGDFVTAWSEQGPTHHVALGVGHVAGTIEKVGHLLGLDTVRVA